MYLINQLLAVFKKTSISIEIEYSAIQFTTDDDTHLWI